MEKRKGGASPIPSAKRGEGGVDCHTTARYNSFAHSINSGTEYTSYSRSVCLLTIARAISETGRGVGKKLKIHYVIYEQP